MKQYYKFKTVGFYRHDLAPHCDRVFTWFPLDDLLSLAANTANDSVETIIATKSLSSDEVFKRLKDSIKEYGRLTAYGLQHTPTPGSCEQIFDHRRYDGDPKILMVDFLDTSDKQKMTALKDYLTIRKLCVLYIKPIKAP